VRLVNIAKRKKLRLAACILCENGAVGESGSRSCNRERQILLVIWSQLTNHFKLLPRTPPISKATPHGHVGWSIEQASSI
jgi:hypothetical protein